MRRYAIDRGFERVGYVCCVAQGHLLQVVTAYHSAARHLSCFSYLADAHTHVLVVGCVLCGAVLCGAVLCGACSRSFGDISELVNQRPTTAAG